VIIADTNVLSEPLRAEPSEAVLAWLREHADVLHITTVTVHELMYGVRRLPAGQRRVTLTTAIERMLRRAATRILPYDDAAARTHAALRAEREAVGLPVAVEDGMIAAIALTHGAAVATRNVRHFQGFGLEVIDPWGQPN
jgi:predicted nucleic acid-binding protein